MEIPLESWGNDCVTYNSFVKVGDGPSCRFLEEVGESWEDCVDGIEDFAGCSWLFEVVGDVSLKHHEEQEGDISRNADVDGGVVLKVEMYLKIFLPTKKSFGKRISRSSLINSKNASPLIPLSVIIDHLLICTYCYFKVSKLWLRWMMHSSINN